MHVAAPREKIPSWTAFKEGDGFDLDEGDPKKDELCWKFAISLKKKNQ